MAITQEQLLTRNDMFTKNEDGKWLIVANTFIPYDIVYHFQELVELVLIGFNYKTPKGRDESDKSTK